MVTHRAKTYIQHLYLRNTFLIIRLAQLQNFPKTNISYPLIRTHTCLYQGVRNVSFFGKFCERSESIIPISHPHQASSHFLICNKFDRHL